MHPFPPIDEIAFLIGAELTQIIIDPYEVRFLLVDSRICVELRSSRVFTYRTTEIEDLFEPSAGCKTQAAIRFHDLLNQRVVALSATTAGDQLTLTFESGARLIVNSEVGGRYESGLISGQIDGRNELWVF
jgi:hypothetical protein